MENRDYTALARLNQQVVWLCLITTILMLILLIYFLPPLQPQEEQTAIMGIHELPAQTYPEEYIKGRTLFVNNCAACHNKNMVDNLTGPALAGVEERWSAYPKEDLYAFIRSSQTMIHNKHPRALELWKEHKPTVMNNFPDLTDEDIEDLLAYIKGN